MSYSKLYNQVNYTANIPFLISTFIREYDISKANINVLYKYGAIDKKKYDMLYNMLKNEREIYVGNMERRDKKITEIKAKGIKEAKRMLFESNNIQDNDILSIKNDAVFLINKKASTTKFDNIEFVEKNIYTSFYRLNNNRLEIYYGYDEYTGTENIDIKGIKDCYLYKHKNYFLSFLLDVFQMAERDTIDNVINMIGKFYELYVSRQLEPDFYRIFDLECTYMISTKSGKCYYPDFIEPKYLDSIDISCNMNIIRDLWGIMSKIKLKNL